MLDTAAVKKLSLLAMGVIALVGVTIFLITRSPAKPRPSAPEVTATPTVEPSGTPEPSPTSSQPLSEDPEYQAVLKANPILAQLPHNTRYWALRQFDGQSEGAYRLIATIYYEPGQNADQKIAQQRPYVEAFIRGTGQPEGSYVVEYKAQMANDTYDD
jgi:hypothetical protein